MRRFQASYSSLPEACTDCAGTGNDGLCGTSGAQAGSAQDLSLLGAIKRMPSTFAQSPACALGRFTHSVCMSVASPDSPKYSLSCILNTLGKSQARVWFCTPKRRSDAMATHSFPFIAMIDAPLYVSICRFERRSARIREHASLFPSVPCVVVLAWRGRSSTCSTTPLRSASAFLPLLFLLPRTDMVHLRLAGPSQRRSTRFLAPLVRHVASAIVVRSLSSLRLTSSLTSLPSTPFGLFPLN